MLINQSYKNFNSYGKTSEDIKHTLPVFMEVLKPFTVEQITSAFKIWCEDESILPTPSDIKKLIVKWKPRAEHQQIEEERIPKYSELTDAQKKEIEQVLEPVKKMNADRKAEKTPRTKPNYAHWNRASDEMKAEVLGKLRPVKMEVGKASDAINSKKAELMKDFREDDQQSEL